jgi:hypothetical protein
LATAVFAFTRQAQLIPAGALFVAWLGESIRSRRARNSWLAPAAVIVGTSAATQLLQMALYPGFSQRDQFFAETGADNAAEAVAAIPLLVARLLYRDYLRFRVEDSMMLVFCLLVAIGLVVCWRRVEAWLCLGAIAGGLVYNIANGNPTHLRYFQPGWICALLLVAALLAHISSRRSSAPGVNPE